MAPDLIWPYNSHLDGKMDPKMGFGHNLAVSFISVGIFSAIWIPDGPARPHYLADIFDSQLHSPKLSLKMPPKAPLPHKRGLVFLFQNCPRREGNCAAIERLKSSRGNSCLVALTCPSRPFGIGACSIFHITRSLLFPSLQMATSIAWKTLTSLHKEVRPFLPAFPAVIVFLVLFHLGIAPKTGKKGGLTFLFREATRP